MIFDGVDDELAATGSWMVGTKGEVQDELPCKFQSMYPPFIFDSPMERRKRENGGRKDRLENGEVLESFARIPLAQVGVSVQGCSRNHTNIPLCFDSLLHEI
jgi:hypothetical protein